MEAMTIDSVYLAEPELQFRYGQKMIDPHAGLELLGPFDADLSSHPLSIPYAVIGTPQGILNFRMWAERMQLAAISIANPENAYLWPPFPGFETTYNCAFEVDPVWTLNIDSGKIDKATLFSDPDKRAYSVANLYVEGLKTAEKRDEPISLAICVVPDVVYERCRSKSKLTEGIGSRLTKRERAMRKRGQVHMFDQFDPEQYQYSVDFRRQLKARAMQHAIPTQIIRESTLRLIDTGAPDERGLTLLSDRMWNLSTAIYYKAGGKPWRLASPRPGVCYVGVSFKKTDPSVENRTACCAAQMFLDSGDGVVFMGESGPWYSPATRQCHLSKEAAKKLLTGVLDTYRQLEGRDLAEVFLHYRSTIDNDEFQGYLSACPSNTKLVGIRVRTERHGLQLFRQGKMPVLRGTLLRIGESVCYLWASGFKPNLGTYDGWEVPAPLRIDIEHGEADIVEVAKDILGLTKLNYNACKLGDSEPVTIGFSDAVGEILVSNLRVANPKPNFKFYI